jgi:phosphoglycolate phosphatase
VSIKYPEYPPNPRAILFDWDNTLVDNWAAIHAALNAAFSAYGLETWTLDQSKARLRKSLRDSFPDYFGDDWKDARKIFYDHFKAVHLQHLQAKPGAEAALRSLKETGIYMGVVSNKSGDYLRAEVAALGWGDCFSHIIGATDAPADKPDPAPVHMALKGAGFGPGSDVWFVGDGAIDVECAANAGMTALIVMGPDTEKELIDHNMAQFIGPNCKINDMGQLKELVDKVKPPYPMAKFNG